MPLSPCPIRSHRYGKLDGIVDDLDPTEDGEAGEEPHGAADEAELGLQGHLHISLNFIISGRVKVDLEKIKRSVLYVHT